MSETRQTPEERIAAMKDQVAERRRQIEEAREREKMVSAKRVECVTRLVTILRDLEGIPVNHPVKAGQYWSCSVTSFRNAGPNGSSVVHVACDDASLITFIVDVNPEAMVGTIEHDGDLITPDQALDLATAVVENAFHLPEIRE